MKIDRDRLRELIKERGTTARAVSREIGTNDTLIRDILSGKSNNPQAMTMARIADALGVPLSQFFTGGEAGEMSSPLLLAELPLIGPVQAGAWLALDDSGQEEPPMIPAAADRRYPHARQWLREVRGDSMNARGIQPGDLVHLVEIIGSGINLNTGMVVEVTRTRAGGTLREVTLKEAEVTDRGVVLWPRSTNPRWAEPVRLNDAAADDIGVEITGLLIARITRF